MSTRARHRSPAFRGVSALLAAAALAVLAGCPAGGRNVPDRSTRVHDGAAATPTDDVDASPDDPTASAPPADVPPPSLAHPDAPRPPDPLDGFFRALDLVEDGEPLHVSILHLGDSHVASDTFSSRARVTLQQRFGDAGRGLAYPGRPWKKFRQSSMTTDQGDGWTTRTGFAEDADPALGVGTTLIRTSTPGAWVRRAACADCKVGRSFRALEAHAAIPAVATEIRALVAGLEVGRTRLDPSPTHLPMPPAGSFVRWRLDLGADEAWDVRIELLRGELTLLGVATDRDAPGVRYESLGINGAQLRHFARAGSNLEAQVAARPPTLVVLAFGTNEAFDRRFDPSRASDEAFARRIAAHRDEIVTHVDRLRAGAPGLSCLVMTPPDLGTLRLAPEGASCRPALVDGLAEPICVIDPPPQLAAIVQAQREAAALAGCAVWDQQVAMGGPGGMAVWQALRPSLAAPDGVHLTSAGYDAMADAFIADLLDARERWRRREPETLRTTPRSPSVPPGELVAWTPGDAIACGEARTTSDRVPDAVR